jgi:hypothetical protein
MAKDDILILTGEKDACPSDSFSGRKFFGLQIENEDKPRVQKHFESRVIHGKGNACLEHLRVHENSMEIHERHEKTKRPDDPKPPYQLFQRQFFC